MTTPELRQALIALQVAALEKVALRQALPAHRPHLERLVESNGIAGAIEELRRHSVGFTAPVQRKPSMFQRLVQRWFGER